MTTKPVFACEKRVAAWGCIDQSNEKHRVAATDIACAEHGVGPGVSCPGLDPYKHHPLCSGAHADGEPCTGAETMPPAPLPAHHPHVDRRGAGARAEAFLAGHSVLCAQLGSDPACPGPGEEAPDPTDFEATRLQVLANPIARAAYDRARAARLASPREEAPDLEAIEALSGEVWRGKTALPGYGAHVWTVAVTNEGHRGMMPWRWHEPHAWQSPVGPLTIAGEWTVCCTDDVTRAILAAWALDERAARERAERERGDVIAQLAALLVPVDVEPRDTLVRRLFPAWTGPDADHHGRCAAAGVAEAIDIRDMWHARATASLRAEFDRYKTGAEADIQRETDRADDSETECASLRARLADAERKIEQMYAAQLRCHHGYDLRDKCDLCKEEGVYGTGLVDLVAAKAGAVNALREATEMRGGRDEAIRRAIEAEALAAGLERDVAKLNAEGVHAGIRVRQLRAVVDALPTCAAEPERGCAMADGRQINIATKKVPFSSCFYCDEHAPADAHDLPYAGALRDLLAKAVP